MNIHSNINIIPSRKEKRIYNNLNKIIKFEINDFLKDRDCSSVNKIISWSNDIKI